MPVAIAKGRATHSMDENRENTGPLDSRMSRRSIIKAGAALSAAGAIGAIGIACGGSDGGSSGSKSSGDCGGGIKVGVLHSLSGTMSISEVSVRDASLLAISEINAAGGVMGKQLIPIVEDGASDWPTFAEKSKKLIQQDKVACVFGCWTSASRKAVLPVFEGLKGLLFYPVQYEGLESSPNIYYTGAEPTQQIIPGVEYLVNELGSKKMYLLGSDYVFPRTA